MGYILLIAIIALIVWSIVHNIKWRMKEKDLDLMGGVNDWLNDEAEKIERKREYYEKHNKK